MTYTVSSGTLNPTQLNSTNVMHFLLTAIFTPSPPLTNGGVLYSGLSVCECVSEWVCASRQPCEHHISETNEGNFRPNLVAGVTGFVDVLIRFRSQKGKVKGHSRRRHNRRRKPVELHLVSRVLVVTLSNGCKTCALLPSIFPYKNWLIAWVPNCMHVSVM